MSRPAAGTPPARPTLLSLDDAGAVDPARAGRKAATLARLRAAGYPVPAGIIVPVTDSHRHAGASADPRADPAVATADNSSGGGVGGTGAAGDLPAGLPGDLPAGLADHVAEILGDGPVAVRSSSPVEDGVLASAAGRYLTVLQVPSREPDLSEAVRRVRTSAQGAPMAVLIQPMVAATAAGVAFGADPVTGDRTIVRIDAVAGLADRLVGGAACPERWVVTGGAARREHTGSGAVGSGTGGAVGSGTGSAVGSGTGTAIEPAGGGAIDAATATRIADLVRSIGAREGTPQDIEWATDGAGLHLLQCRPITALPTPPVVDLPPGSWVSDPGRYPEGMTPFGMSLAAPEVSKGLTAAFQRCGALVDRVELRGVAGRPYLRFVPVGGRSGNPPPGPILGVLARTVPALRTRCRRARALLASGELEADIREWNADGRERATRAVDPLRSVDLTSLTDAGLADHLYRVCEVVRTGLAIHFRLMAPYLIGVYGLVRTCRELLGRTPAEVVTMLAGLSPASDEPTRSLTAIADAIAGDPSARAAMGGDSSDSNDDGNNSGDGSVDEDRDGTLERLRAAAPDLALAFDAWCATYGLRTANDDPGSPTLHEIPGLLVGLLATQVRRVTEAGPAGGGARDGSTPRERAERAVAGARHALSGRPAADRARFEDALAAATAAYPVREDNVLWALSVPSGLARRAVLEIGARLQRRGEIDAVRDVVMLDADTVLAAARGQHAPELLRPQIARAKAERAWVASHPLPAGYGPAPSPMPDLRWLPRAARIVNEALHLDAPPGTRAPSDAVAPAGSRARTGATTGARTGTTTGTPTDTETGTGTNTATTPAAARTVLSGVPGSPGRYTGPVRIVRGPSDFASLRRGEVVVCAVTDPAWSVLFAIAGAVIADAGGMLAHSAIIAREHGIPAVLGTGSATQDLADGQVVTVDGTRGCVLSAMADTARPRR